MKIAIQGHPTRGKEIIQILRSLGATSYDTYDTCSHPEWYWYINKNREITCDPKRSMCGYKLYTLEEFEKEFPFKVGDKVTFKKVDIRPYTIKSFSVWSDGDIVCEFEETMLHYPLHELKPYKEMKEERNITLTLDKAKEWYKKGGELKEIALQTFTEKELNPLPKSWEEYCMTYGCVCLSARYTNISIKYDSLIKLEQLRDCWRQGWIPDYTKTYKKYRIKKLGTEYIVDWSTGLSDFLVFQTEELAKEFLNCFKNLIEKVGDLI